jgi:hypothetical protein
MRQLFFIAPNGFLQVKASGVQSTHGWNSTGGDASTNQIVGVVEMMGNMNAERIIDKLEAAGIMWLPNHHSNEVIKPEHAEALAPHGVVPTDTTAQAMTKLFTKSGFPPLKPSRF